MTRAVYEGVALNAAWLLDPFRAFTGVDYREITFGGGERARRCGATILADALGITVHRLAEPQYTNARGAALLAFGVLGRLDPDAADRVRGLRRRTEPDPERARCLRGLRARFAGFHARERFADCHRRHPRLVPQRRGPEPL